MAGEYSFNSHATGHNAAPFNNGLENASFDTEYNSFPLDPDFPFTPFDARRDSPDPDFDATMFGMEQDCRVEVNATMFNIEHGCYQPDFDATMLDTKDHTYQPEFDVTMFDTEHDVASVNDQHNSDCSENEQDVTLFEDEQSVPLCHDEHDTTLFSSDYKDTSFNRVIGNHRYHMVESNGILQHVHQDEASLADSVDVLERNNTHVESSTVKTAVDIIYTPGERDIYGNNTPQDQEREWALQLGEFIQRPVQDAYQSGPENSGDRDVTGNEYPARSNSAPDYVQNCAGPAHQPFKPASFNAAISRHNAEGSMGNAATPKYAQPAQGPVTKFQCTICGSMKLNSAESLKSHMKKLHINVTKHCCDWLNCDFKCTEKKDLHRHVDSVHKRKIIYRCPTCDKGFSREDNGRRHFKKCNA